MKAPASYRQESEILQRSEPYKVNSLAIKEQMAKLSSANFQKMLSPSYIILRIQKTIGQTV